jgi:hypothetical protein
MFVEDKRFPKTSPVPRHIREGMLRYVDEGLAPGSFLQAVICNDLLAAACRADDECRSVLREIVQWFHLEAPAECWGSLDKLDAWLAKHEARRAAEVRDRRAWGER